MDDKLLLRQVSMITGVLSDLMKEVADIRKRIMELEKGGSRQSVIPASVILWICTRENDLNS